MKARDGGAPDARGKRVQIGLVLSLPALALVGLVLYARAPATPDGTASSRVSPPVTAPAAAPPRGSTPGAPPPPRFAPSAAAAEPARQASCRACEDENRGGLCRREMGCEGLSGADKELCQSLLRCLRAHPECNATNPALCYCGAATGLECLKTPQGPCAREALAAAKTTDPRESARRFFLPGFPSGRASQVSACHLRACREQCLGVPL